MTEARKNLNEAKENINKAIILLKETFNDPNTSLSDMGAIMDYARLLNYTDFAKSLE